MTVKLAKFFTNNSLGNGIVGSTTMSTPPAPMPTPISTMNLHSHYFQQQQQQRLNYNPYMVNERIGVGAVVPDEEELDNMSIYSGNMMTSRNHPCNNSQRPLLAERKPAQLLVSQSAKFSKPPKQTNQPQYQQKYSQESCQPPQIQIKHIKSYLPAYVPQQKRDSAKGLHGFNDFDILSQQYNQHLLQSPHIGYPYGSPPSPTANSSDFVFDTATISSNSAKSSNMAKHGNIQNYNNKTTNNEVNYYNSTQQQQNQVASCFEDDFCTDNGSHTIRPDGGPFIFGVPYEKQIGTKSGGQGFCNSTDTVLHSDDSTDLQRHVKSMTVSHPEYK